MCTRIYCQDPNGMGPWTNLSCAEAWDPGGPSYSSRSSVPMDLDKLINIKKIPRLYPHTGLSSLPYLVAVILVLAPNNHLGNPDHMGSSGIYLD